MVSLLYMCISVNVTFSMKWSFATARRLDWKQNSSKRSMIISVSLNYVIKTGLKLTPKTAWILYVTVNSTVYARLYIIAQYCWQNSGCYTILSRDKFNCMVNTLCSKKSDAKIHITITTAYLIRIKYPLSGFNYHRSDVNVANFNKIHRIVSEQQLF